MKRLLILFILLLPFALKAEEAFDLANKNYQEGNYEVAIMGYEGIVKLGFESPELYFNLGNAYFKIRNYPAAILNYERAKLLSPDDEDIKFNLELTNSLVTDKINSLPVFILTTWLQGVRTTMTSDGWALTGIGMFVLFLGLTLLTLFMSKTLFRKLGFLLAFLLLVISGFAVSFSYISANEKTQSGNAIVMTPVVTVKSSPDQSGTDLFILHEGAKVTVREDLGDWAEISIADGSKGWVPAGSFNPI